MVEAPPRTMAAMVPEYIQGPRRRPATRNSLLDLARRMPHQPMASIPAR
ncbi:hypothetical protein SALBM135S_05509 [Streptomyces alboniger]